MAYGKAIELFLVNGTSEGIVTATLSNWNGKAVKIPRTDVQDCTREDIAGIGMYFLFCENARGADSVYIGESENVLDRLRQHIRDYERDTEKYYWSTAVVFVGTDLDKAMIRYAENRFVCDARRYRQYQVLTKNTYGSTVMKESQIATMDEYLENARTLLHVMGYAVFAEPRDADKTVREMRCFGNGAEAAGHFSTGGFTVLRGSLVSDHESQSFMTRARGYYELKRKLEESGVIKKRKFTVDYEFRSPSAAASVVLGRSANGKKEWVIAP